MRFLVLAVSSLLATIASATNSRGVVKYELGVHVRTESGLLMDQPVLVLVRGHDGLPVKTVMTDRKGDVQFEIEWQKGLPPLQIEARLAVSDRRSVGVLTTFASNTNQYCFTLSPLQADECGEAGTGPPTD